MGGTDAGQTAPRTGNRRRWLWALGIVGLLAVAVGAVVVLGGGDEPEEAATEFVETLDDGEFAEADAMIHPDSPIDGAGEAAAILAIALPVDDAVDVVPIHVEETELLTEDGGEATVAITVNVEVLGVGGDVDVPLEMRTENGEWRVWNLDL